VLAAKLEPKVYVPEAASSPQVSMVPGRRTAAEAMECEPRKKPMVRSDQIEIWQKVFTGDFTTSV
jgi:hypothetical protein